jgi:hypothetical protein
MHVHDDIEKLRDALAPILEKVVLRYIGDGRVYFQDVLYCSIRDILRHIERQSSIAAGTLISIYGEFFTLPYANGCSWDKDDFSKKFVAKLLIVANSENIKALASYFLNQESASVAKQECYQSQVGSVKHVATLKRFGRDKLWVAFALFFVAVIAAVAWYGRLSLKRLVFTLPGLTAEFEKEDKTDSSDGDR